MLQFIAAVGPRANDRRTGGLAARNMRIAQISVSYQSTVPTATPHTLHFETFHVENSSCNTRRSKDINI